MSYIIKNGEIIAATNKFYKSGLEVRYSYDRCEEKIDANRDYNLVNAKYAKISNAKEYDKLWHNMCVQECDLAIEISENEFYIY